MRAHLLTIPLLLLAHSAIAASCAPTPSLGTQNYPGAANIPNGNNLLLPAGKSIAASGQQLMVIGHVLDRNCVPVAGATVELWQANPFGKWTLASRADRATPYPSFAGAGRATTDNDGQFIFITAFPAPVGARAPNLNLRVYAQDVPTFSTVLYFGNESRNANDALYRTLGNAARNAVTMNMGSAPDGSGIAGSATITLPAKAPYRTF